MHTYAIILFYIEEYTMYDSEELLQDFIIEAKEHLESIEPNIFRLEKEPEERADILNEIFRPMHSLKGASGFLGLEKINSLAHKAESVMDELRKGAMDITSNITDAILVTTEVLGNIVEHLEEHGVEGDIDIVGISDTLQDILAHRGDVQDDMVQEEHMGNEHSTTLCNYIEVLTHDIDTFLHNPNGEGVVTSLLEVLRNIAYEAQHSALDDIMNSAKNTIEIIEKTQQKGEDFAPLLPILQQELTIIVDLTKHVINTGDDEREQCIETLQQAITAFTNEPHSAKTIDILYEVLLVAKQYAQEHGNDDVVVIASNVADIIHKTQESNTSFEPLIPIITQEVAIIIGLLDTTTQDTKEYNIDRESDNASLESKGTAGIKEQSKNNQNAKAVQHKDVKEQDKMKHSSFIRVDHHKLDQLMNLIGELIITRNRYSLLVRSLEDEERNVKDIARIAQNLTETTSSMARISDALQDTIMQVRMVSLSATFSRLPRLVRDISKKSGKDVELHIIGEETELDKNMVEALADPLLHLIRNAVDHGIELPEERLQKGKKAKGNVWIRAFHKGNSVVIEIEDDGKGMDPERLKEIAIEKGVITQEEAKFITNDQAFELIFLPGFSSAKEVTDISGRGVGMDVVRTNIKNLKGSISINSVIGSGSTFTLSFPLTLAIIEALMVEVNSQTFAIPLDTVSETTKISKTHIKKVQDTEAITLRGEVLSIVHLADKLGFVKEEHSIPEIISVVIVTINNRKVGLVVDKLLERQEIVIKSLGNYPIASVGISGATITGDGGVILIINPHDLCAIPTRKNVS